MQVKSLANRQGFRSLRIKAKMVSRNISNRSLLQVTPLRVPIQAPDLGNAGNIGPFEGQLIYDRLMIVNWGIPKIWLSDRDPKVLSDMWTTIWSYLGSRILYSTAYHPETHGQTERYVQTIQSCIRHYIHSPTLQSSPSDAFQVRTTGDAETEMDVPLGVPGDSGAWVVARHSGDVAGHVLAWSEVRRVAYLCPQLEQFE